MIKPAQLTPYKDQLEYQMVESWYKPENKYYSGTHGNYTIELPDNNCGRRCLVSVDPRTDHVIGYISFLIDWETMSAERFGIISFDKGNPIFAQDLYKVISGLFEENHINRVQWSCISDNPVIKSYRAFIEHYGGHECGHYHQCAKLSDGYLHDRIDFEIISSEFRQEAQHDN